MKKSVYMSVVLVALLLTAVIALVVATDKSDPSVAGEAMGSFPEYSVGDLPPRGSVSVDEVSVTYSGDDAYDPAAGGLAFLLSIGDLAAVTYSGDDAYDPAAGGLAFLLPVGDLAGVTYSGDDAYDPAAAAAGLPIVLSIGDLADASYGEEAAYDPTAGGWRDPGGSDLSVGSILESIGGQCSVDDYLPEGAC